MPELRRPLRPFFSFFGGKWTLAPWYPRPEHSVIVEPFAGSAGYATRYSDREVVLVEREPVVASIWRWLIGVSVDEIMALPLDPEKRHALRPEARALIGFWCGRGRTQPANTTTSAWLLSGKWPSSFWGTYARQRIADQVQRIRHWRLIEGDYRSAPDVEATWYVDPPYVNMSRTYRHGNKSIDYPALGAWCRRRQGQVIVCENEGANWLPFRPFATLKPGVNGRGSREVIWTSA